MTRRGALTAPFARKRRPAAGRCAEPARIRFHARDSGKRHGSAADAGLRFARGVLRPLRLGRRPHVGAPTSAHSAAYGWANSDTCQVCTVPSLSAPASSVPSILAEAGYEQVYDIDEIITRMPTPDEVARLGISTGTPVAEHIRTGYTATDKPVRVMISVISGDALILQYTIPT